MLLLHLENVKVLL